MLNGVAEGPSLNWSWGLLMLPEILIALAASGGTAVVTAAGTDAWTETRTIVARLLGRDGRREETVLQRLDQTAAELARVPAGDTRTALEQVSDEQARSWQTRFEDLLEDLPEAARNEAVEELRRLVEHVRQHGPGSGASAGDGGIAANGGVIVTATGGSVAAGVLNGDVRVGPPGPGATQD
ncbi:hypothetical protein ABZ464_36550 [Streptomyces sp. NPDC005820]|uniref:hypothetical protein n=1 Tax=Streptomyces sp. NPDC005820 TaxID=3157069 RepID=UPI0033D6151C